MNLKKYINYKNLIKLILIFILFYFSSLWKYIPIILLKINPKNISPSTNMLLSIFSSLCTLIILLIIYRKDLIEYGKKFKKEPFRILDSSFKYYLLGILGMIISNLFITLILKGSGANNEKIVQNMISENTFLMFISAGILAPIIEELVFRKSYLDTFKTKKTFIIISSLVFGGMHVLTSSTTILDYLYFIPYTCLGLALATMDYKENNIYPSIIMHMFHNSLLIILSTL